MLKCIIPCFREEIEANCGYVRNNKFERRFHDTAVGQIVLTRYNNKHYKIDDIDWSSNPTDTFTLKSGQEASFTIQVFFTLGFSFVTVKQTHTC